MALLTIFLRSLLFIAYLSIGMVTFMRLEGDNQLSEQKKKDHMQEKLMKNMTTQFNMSKEEFSQFVSIAVQAYANPSGEWDPFNTFEFTLQTVTTIGYGTITPKTDGGRLLCIFYALFGIPVAALLLQALGKSHHALVSATIKAVESKCTSGKEVVYQEEKCVLGTLISFIFMICIGAWIYTNEEGTYLEGTYAWFITFTTIGYGDIVPGGHSKNPGYIWVRLIVIMLGLTVTASVLTAISSCLEKRDVKALTCSGCPAGCLVKLCCPAGRCYGHSVGSPGTYRSDPVFELDNSGRIQEDEEKNA